MYLYQSTTRDQSGFSVVETLLVVLVIAALAVTGLVVYHRHNKPGSAKNIADTSTSQTTTQPHSTTTTQTAPDPYAGWQTYTNSTYGISFKKSDMLKGKQAVTYDVVNSGTDSKLYLFSVGSKTYTFGSINEELNVQYSPDYWSTFQKIFDSLTLQ